MTTKKPNNDPPKKPQETPAQDAEHKERDEEQARLWKLYQEQQRRRACPGCGEEPFLG